MTRDAQPTILVVDDEVRSLEAIRRTLEEDFHVLSAEGADSARELMSAHEIAVVLCDQRMPGTSGVSFLSELRERWPDTVRVIVSGYTDAEDIIAGVNEAGIYQYLCKPWLPERLLQSMRDAAALHALQREEHRLDLELRSAQPVVGGRVAGKRRTMREHFSFERIVRAPGSPIESVLAMAARVAAFDIPVLILGESGTGKELLARSIHYASSRTSAPFVMENCAAIPDQLLESELFGHRRGAFTGAFEDHHGLFARADQGTVFLDEIGDTSASMQVRLLRVLQDGEYRPVGAGKTERVDVRVIAATHRDLGSAVSSGDFREDLFYRLNAVTITMPPLRARPADIGPIASALLEQVGVAMGKPMAGFTADAIGLLASYPWPGNIRELRNEILRAVALADGERIAAHDLSPTLTRGPGSSYPCGDRPGPHATAEGTLRERVERFEAAILRDALIRHRWNRSSVARELGLSRVGLRQKMQRCGLGESPARANGDQA